MADSILYFPIQNINKSTLLLAKAQLRGRYNLSGGPRDVAWREQTPGAFCCTFGNKMTGSLIKIPSWKLVMWLHCMAEHCTAVSVGQPEIFNHSRSKVVFSTNWGFLFLKNINGSYMWCQHWEEGTYASTRPTYNCAHLRLKNKKKKKWPILFYHPPPLWHDDEADSDDEDVQGRRRRRSRRGWRDEQTNKQGKIELLSQWTLVGWDEQ